LIDRVARQRAAETIRHYISGVITNKEFEERYPISKRDPIISAVDDTLWATYDDIYVHKLRGTNSVSKEIKQEIARWLMFLYSDQEYLWPKISNAGLLNYFESCWFFRITGMAKLIENQANKFKTIGDYDVWPFIKVEDYKKKMKKPILLASSKYE